MPPQVSARHSGANKTRRRRRHCNLYDWRARDNAKKSREAQRRRAACPHLPLTTSFVSHASFVAHTAASGSTRSVQLPPPELRLSELFSRRDERLGEQIAGQPAGRMRVEPNTQADCRARGCTKRLRASESADLRLAAGQPDVIVCAPTIRFLVGRAAGRNSW